MRDAELQAAREERDLAVRDKMDAMRIKCVRCSDGSSEDAADTESGADEKNSSLIPELLRKAWEQRDGAVRRKNAVQVQLARTRVDVLQANGQLMEAIGQKVELSQQLEQWQVGIETFPEQYVQFNNNTYTDIKNTRLNMIVRYSIGTSYIWLPNDGSTNISPCR